MQLMACRVSRLRDAGDQRAHFLDRKRDRQTPVPRAPPSADCNWRTRTAGRGWIASFYRRWTWKRLPPR